MRNAIGAQAYLFVFDSSRRNTDRRYPFKN